MDYTRIALRARIATLLGDHIASTATSGSTTTLVDTVELKNYAGADAAATDRLAGHYVFIHTGTGSGQERVITTNAQSTGTITVPTWTAPNSTSVYEIHSEWRVYEYNAALNQAINDLRGDNGALIPLVADVSLSMTDDGTAASLLYTLPVGFRTLSAIIPEGTIADIYDEIPLAYVKDYTIEKKALASASATSTTYLRIERHSDLAPIADRQLRIIGAGYQDELATDTATCSEHLLTFIVHQACAYLLEARVELGTPGSQANVRRVDRHYALAENARGRLEHRSRPGDVLVPI